ncbi:RNA polymerase sigma-70 factor [Pseudonocardiaceae bacterium YIM PH 21723]|nr:RNA polymerase sigma-70 factor [Pseudonocardiaceae bacterium YIM PH 21723]
MDLQRATEVFAEVRPRLFGIAYRMLGSALDAEDLVQEVWLRWQAADRTAVANPAAYLATAITRLAINAATTARATRETYIGPWLPEPVDTSADPQLGAERAAGLEFAMLLLLERLSPAERAAYVLREAFDYPYDQIAEITQGTEVAARQLVSRARKRIAAQRRVPVAATDQRRLLTAFLSAAMAGDLSTLERLFAQDVVSYTDGGGVKGAARIPVAGAQKVAKFVAAFSGRFWQGIEIRWIEVNGQPGAALSRTGSVVAVVALTATGEGIEQLLWTMNPAKLTGVPNMPVTDGGANLS